MQDPIMKPFAEDFRNQLQHKWTQTHQKLGINWEDLEGVPTGEDRDGHDPAQPE